MVDFVSGIGAVLAVLASAAVGLLGLYVTWLVLIDDGLFSAILALIATGIATALTRFAVMLLTIPFVALAALIVSRRERQTR